MPRIENANHLQLNSIVDQLTADGTPDTQELCSKGKDLYAKGAATPTASSRRGERLSQAVTLVRDCLAEEFNTTAENAQQILTNVFGQAPSRMTVSDLKRLRDLGKTAAPLITEGCDAVEAFTSAQAPKEAPKSAPSPALPPITTTVSVPENTAATADPTLEEVRKWLPDLQPEEMASEGLLLACGIAAGTMTPEQASSRLNTRLKLMSFSNVLVELIKLNLPSYASSTPKQLKTWLNIARAISQPGLFIPKCLKYLTTDQKLSVQQALADLYTTLAALGATISKLGDVAFAYVLLNEAYQLSELMSPGEENAMDAFFSDIGKNKIVCHAYAHWAAMDETQRKEVIQTLIDLHAEKFGYTKNKPALAFDHSDDPTVAGFFNNTDNKLVVFTTCQDFDTFGSTFNTVIHELTHKFQHELAARLKAHQIEPDEPQHTQACLFDANTRFYIYSSTLTETFGFSESEADSAYRSNLMELHARHWGDVASSLIDKLFAPQAPTGEKQ